MTLFILSARNACAVLATDGRFSGATRGICVGYVSSEAAEGGPMVLVEEDDVIEIDLNRKRIDLLVKK
ncbi:MAG: hypothetical protein DSO07_11150 [Thermoproteota archaeon]|nr:MAG: hypothetical protein DSO07_11150 [Candidatus Korarchaeota archaeon]